MAERMSFRQGSGMFQCIPELHTLQGFHPEISSRQFQNIPAYSNYHLWVEV